MFPSCAADAASRCQEPAAVRRLASVAAELNQSVRNIGARRLHAVMEKVFEDISFGCQPGQVVISEPYVTSRLQSLLESTDLRKSLMVRRARLLERRCLTDSTPTVMGDRMPPSKRVRSAPCLQYSTANVTHTQVAAG